MQFVFTLLAVAGMVNGQADPDAALEQARARLQAMAHHLEKYVCIETVNRNYYRQVVSRDAPVRSEAAPACSQTTPATTAGSERRELESTDRVRLEVTVSQSRELHSWPGATGFDTRDVDELIRNGPVSTGSFGSDLTSVFGKPGVTFQYLGEKPAKGRTQLEYSYHVPVAASNFAVKIAGAWVNISFEGEFWLDPKSLNLERMTIRTNELPPEATFCQAATTLNYQLVRIGDSDVLLPRQSELEIVLKGGRETRNETTFASCREYQAESELTFDLPASDGRPVAPRTGWGRVSLPIGLPVTLALEGPIDSDTAATGDPIAAKVLKPVRRPGSNEELIPAGAVVRGRIRRVEHHFFPKPYFLVAIAFNRVEWHGVLAPFAARSEANPDMAKELDANLEMRATGIWFWDVGTFLFPTAKPRFVVPAGFESKWYTLDTGGGR
jgi:hypothetical protein